MQLHAKTGFLPKKVMELQQALFFNQSNAVLKLPTSIINALYVDDVEQVWFFIKRPSQCLNEFESEFRGKLDFYRKGKDFYLQLTGKAYMVTDPEEINSVEGLTASQKYSALTNMVLVRFKISDVQYFAVQPQRVRALPEGTKVHFQPLAFIKSLQYIVKDIIPVFQSH